MSRIRASEPTFEAGLRTGTDEEGEAAAHQLFARVRPLNELEFPQRRDERLGVAGQLDSAGVRLVNASAGHQAGQQERRRWCERPLNQAQRP